MYVYLIFWYLPVRRLRNLLHEQPRRTGGGGNPLARAEVYDCTVVARRSRSCEGDDFLVFICVCDLGTEL